MRARTGPSFCSRSHIAVARRTRASFCGPIVSAGNTGRALRRDRTSQTTRSDPLRAITSSSSRPTRTLRPQISKPRSSNHAATNASPRRARSHRLSERVADAVASSQAVAAGLEDLLANEAPWASAGWKIAFRRRGAPAGAVHARFDFACWHTGRLAARTIVFLEVARVTSESSDEADAGCALHRAGLEIGFGRQESTLRDLLGHARIAHRAARAARYGQPKQRNRRKSQQFKPFPAHHAPLRTPRSSTA